MAILLFLTLVVNFAQGQRPFPTSPKESTSSYAGEMISELFRDIRTKQSVIFTSNETIPESQALILALSNRTSNYLIDMKSVKASKDQRSINLMFFTHPRHSTMYFLLKKGNNKSTFDQLKDFLREIGALSPVATRPRCLLIIYGRIRGIPKHHFDKMVREFLDWAWSLKFLDLTIAHFVPGHLPMIFHFNPFRDEFVKFRYDNTTTSDLFPRKLVNAKNYTLFMPLGYTTKASCVYRDKNGEIEMFALTDQNWFIFVKQFFAYTNIKVSWVVTHISVFLALIGELALLRKLSANIYPMTTMSYFVSGNRSLVEQVETSRFFEFEKFDMFVPIITTSTFEFPWQIFETALSFVGVILTYYVVARILKFPRANWSAKRIISVLLGRRAEFVAEAFAESVAFITLSLMCLGVTSDLIDSFLGFLKNEQLLVYESLEDINNANFKLMIFQLHNWADDNDTVLRELKNKTVVMKGFFQEIGLLADITICVCPKSIAKFVVNFLKKHFPGNPPLIVPSNITMFSAGKALPFEKNSPLVDTFDMVALRTKEFGLDVWAANIYQDRCTNVEGNYHNHVWETPQKSKNISSIYVLGLYFCGSIIAIVAFIWEWSEVKLAKVWREGCHRLCNWIRIQRILDQVRWFD